MTNILENIQKTPVEWKRLGDVAAYEQPTKYLVASSDYRDEFETPVLTAGKTFILGYTDETHGIYRASANPVIIFDDFTTANKWVDFDFKVKSSAMKMITSADETQVLLKYIFYWLNTLPNEQSESDHKRQWISNYAKKQIPIPPLELQREIVRVLDLFSEKHAALAAALRFELAARQKQYAFYRDFLLSADNLHGAAWLSLGDVAKKISSGGTPKTDNPNYYGGEIPWLRTQEVDFCEIWDTSVKITEEGLKNSSAKWIPANCVIVAMYGATVGKIGINKIPMTTNQACANIEVDEKVLNYKYLFHYLSSQYEFIKSLGKGSQTNINAQIVKNLKIPIPPLDQQAKIVDILDRFEMLANSLAKGLPREIELRKKQYEYYREQLLNFAPA